MKRRIPFFLWLLLGAALSLQAGKPIAQRFFVCNFDNKDMAFTSLPAVLPELRRGAFPLTGRSIVIDLYRPIVVDRVVIPLRKFEAKHPDTRSEADKMQVYCGMDRDQLNLAPHAKVSVVPGEENGTITEIITVTNLPKARYLLFYAPRTDKYYVFGIQDGKKEIQVWADAPLMMDPKIAALPDVSTLDPNWERTVLPMESCGFQSVSSEADVAVVPYEGSGGNAQIGWPWTNRFVEFALKEPQQLSRIVVELRKMQMQFPEMTTGLENAVVYQSENGKNFQTVPVQVKHMLFRKGEEVYSRVTISGNFSGKYFRIYAPWTKKYYVFGTRRTNTALKAFPAGAALSAFELPLYQTGKTLSFAFRLDGPADSRGTLLLQTADSPALTLWSAEITPEMMNRENHFSCPLPGDFSGGSRQLQLAVMIGEKKKCSTEAKLMYQPTARILAPAENGGNWQTKIVSCATEKKQLFFSTASGAVLEYEIPETGEYAVYLFMAGKKPVHFRGGTLSGETKLEMWHPADLSDSSAGLTYLAAGSLQAGEKLSMTAEAEGTAVGEVVLLPLSGEQKEILNAQRKIKPVVILHSDGYSDFFSRDIPPEYLDERIDSAKRGHAFAFDWCVGTTAVNFPSRIASNFGMQKNPVINRDGDKKAIARLQKLLSQCDPLQRLVERSRRDGMRLSITVRSNPFYVPLNSMLNAQYFIDRPHCLLRRKDGSTGYLQLSYAHEDTRTFFLTLIQEVAAYQPDAIVMDFLRHPPFFGYDEPLKKEYEKRYGSYSPEVVGSSNWQRMCAEILTEHIRNVRRAIDRINPNIALELSCDWAKYYQHGVDLETLLKEGLLDVISPGIYEIGEQKYFPLAPFRTMIAASPRKVLLIPRVEGTIYGGDPTAAEEKGLEVILRRNVSENMFRALWLRFAAEGADGLRPFNTGGASLAVALADEAGLRRFETFVMPMLDFRAKIQPVQK